MVRVKRKHKVLPHRILKRKTINHKVLKKLALAIFITLVAAAIYSAAASHTQAAKDYQRLQDTSIQLNINKKKLQQEIKAHGITNEQQIKQIEDLNKQLKDTQDQLQAKKDSSKVYADEYVAPTQVAAPVSSYSGSGDPYLDYIIAHESSGNQYAVNSIGACGLFQALPCSKLGCDLSDVQCQLNWGRNYAIQRYGSTAAAYTFWVNNKWW